MATFDLGALVIDTIVDLTGLERGLEDAQQQSHNQGAGIANALMGAMRVGIMAGAAALTAAIVGIGGAALDIAGQTDAATRTIQAQLGTTAEEAERLADVALQTFGDNWYGSVEEAAEAVGLIRQQLGDMSDEDLRSLAGGVAAIADNFEQEAPAVIDAVRSIRENFPGTTEQQALDMITAGFQRGLNSSGDFLETITEYGVQFRDSGATADQFFSILETGAATGVLGTDKIADAFKESRIRIAEMTDEVIESYRDIGDTLVGDLNQQLVAGTADIGDVTDAFNEFGITLTETGRQAILSGQSVSSVFGTELAAAVERGELSIADAQQIAIQGLQAMDNQLQQNAAGVAIFGTQWEDLGPSALLAVDMAATGLGELAGATDSLNVRYTSFGDMWEGVSRRLLVAIEPFGDKLLDLANAAMPTVMAVFDAFAALVPPLIEQATGLIDGMVAEGATLGTELAPIVEQLAAVWATDLQPALQAVWTFVQTQLLPLLRTLGEAVIPVLRTAVEVLAAVWSNVLVPAVRIVWQILSQTLVPALQVVAGWLRDTLPSAVRTLGGILTGTLVPAVGGAVQAFGSALTGAVGAARGALQTAERAMQSVRDAAGTLAGRLGDLARSFGEGLQGAINGARETIGRVATWFDNIRSSVQGVIDRVAEFVRAIGNVRIPDWLRGRSPPPLANWFSYIADAAGAVAAQIPPLDVGLSGIAPDLPVVAPASAEARITVDDRGVGWLRELIRVEIVAHDREVAGRADARRRML